MAVLKLASFLDKVIFMPKNCSGGSSVIQIQFFIAAFGIFLGLCGMAQAQTGSKLKIQKEAFAEKYCVKLGVVKDVLPFKWKKTNTSTSVSKDWVTDNYQNSLGSPGEFRWFSAKGNSEIYLERFEDGKDFYAPPIPLSSCTTETNGAFTLFKCNASVLMYNGRHLISVSVEDYSAPQVEFIEQLKFNEQDAVLIAVGIKAGKAWYVIPKDFGKFEPKKCFEEKELLD